MTISRWRERIAAAGAWRLTYEAGLLILVTAGATVGAVTADLYPLAPWLVGFTTAVLMVSRLVDPLGTYVVAALIGLGTGGLGVVPMVVLSASLSYRATRVWQVAAGLATGWVCFVLSVLWETPLTVEWGVLVSAMYALLACAPAGVARLVRRRRTLLAAMHHRNVQLHSGQAEVARQAQIRERARIARDLHDSLGNRLTLISLYAGMMQTDEAQLIRQASSAAMTELRQILGLLAQDGTQPSVRPLSGLDELVEQARASGAQVEIAREGEPRPLTAMTEHAAYRVIQEGVTNALRHAHGGSIKILLRYEPDALIAAVTNTAGRRTAQVTSGQGLLGLAERVRVANGVLFHGPAPDGGFRLAATLAYTADEPAPAAAPTGGPDFVALVERHGRRSRIVMVATAVSIAGFLVLCGAGIWLTTALVSVDRATYDAIRIGQPETDVRAKLPPPDEAATGVPDGCADYPAALLEQLRTESDEMIYRFCFRDGVLVDKQVREGKP
ncbi:two-component sensor histidine kinase [Actinoplanes philippinensis]|uniref:histidine kinase n=1 Tax=Actinoplanes philippinensis TaxID=35752 RepID=A0A1I2MCE0_9ACTN|nr:histidine kinase [Actinoplanes philippinensis]GIE76355.1 two-component sensor histidine kinase [Actinoplanes philippinensis]SFF89112.1 Signal transduction histidine kinase [Actinoplanes philippinensis]